MLEEVDMVLFVALRSLAMIYLDFVGAGSTSL